MVMGYLVQAGDQVLLMRHAGEPEVRQITEHQHGGYNGVDAKHHGNDDLPFEPFVSQICKNTSADAPIAQAGTHQKIQTDEDPMFNS